jgi:hypothetical protein
MTVVQTAEINTFIGLSSDTKPTSPAPPAGSTFLETDTSVQSVWDGSTWWRAAVAQGYAVIKVTELFTGTTTYNYTTGARALYVECIGGGGAGGSAATGATNSAAAGGGGGGGYSCAFLTGLPPNPITVAIGVGGTPGAAGANPGGVGGDTTFGATSLCTGKGGAGGLAATVAAGPVIGGAGGAGGASGSGVGDLKADGCAGGNGFMLAAAHAISGTGGDSLFSGGALGQTTQHAGAAGGNYGGGGSGGTILSGGASVAGGAGGAGVMRITELA